MTRNGVELREAYLGPAGVLTGSARVAQEARERDEESRALREYQSRRVALSRKLRAAEIQMTALEAEKEAAIRELESAAVEVEERRNLALAQRQEMARSRKVQLQPKLARMKASEAGA